MTELAERVAKLEASTDNLVGWQKSQNGSIHRVEDKTDKLNDKIDKLQYWIMGQLAATVLALALFLAKGGA